MTSDGRRSQRLEVPSQRGRNRQKLAGTMQRFAPVPRFGPPRNDLRPPATRQPEGAYLEVPDRVVDILLSFTRPSRGQGRRPQSQWQLFGSVANHCKILQCRNGFVTCPGRRAYFTSDIGVGRKINR